MLTEAVPRAASVMSCASCQKDLPGDFRFCPYCGAEQPLACRSCGARIEGSFAFCPHCGAARIAPAVAPPRDRKPVAARASQSFPRPFVAVARRGERRVVTVLFADVVGFTKLSERYDAETLTEMMNRLFERFGAVVRRYEGVVDKFIGDAAMILFGAPTAHEDDAERAVLTARDMMALLPAVNEDFRSGLGIDPRIQIHVGIATGLVVAGSVAPEEGGGYTVMGDAVNLASRLEDISPPGEIYIAESTYRLVSGRVRAEVVQTLRVKGKDEPVTVYRVTGADPAAGDSRGLSAFYSPMVGRGNDVATLAKTFQDLADGRGGIVVIDGPAGVGKSRLVRESLEAIEGEGIRPRVHVGRCISYGRTVPYYPWSQILTSLLTESLLHRLTPEEVAVLQQVSTGAFGNRTPAEAERHRQTVFDAFSRLVASASQSCPRILVLEDMHWADTTTADLAAALLPMMEKERVVLLVVMRSRGSVSDLPTDLSRVIPLASTVLHLAPLMLDETKLLIENLTCNVAGFDEQVRGQIALRSEGLPLFVEEILRSYVEDGVLVRELDFWRFQKARAGTAAETVPTTLHALLSSRVDRIPSHQRARLELASVIGKDFDPRLVDRLAQLSHDEAPWRELEADGEIQRTPDPGGGRDRYRFSQVLVQEVIYATLLRTRRQELHAAVARALEADRPRLEENLHALAYHFEQAGTPERAAPYYLAAAAQAKGVYANREALDLYDNGLRVAPNAQAATEALLGKARLLRQLGVHGDAAEAVERLVEMARARGDVAEEANMLSERAWIAYQSGDGAGILRFAERAIERAKETGSPRAMVHPLRVLGVAHEFAGNFASAREAYRRLVEIAETFDDRPHVTNTYNSLGEMARACEEYDDAIEWYRRSMEGSSKGPSTTYLNNVGAALCGKGAYDEALEALDACIAERRRTGYLAFISEAYYYRALARLGKGMLREAEEDARDSLAQAEEHEEVEMVGLALRLGASIVAAGGTFVHEGRPVTAEGALRSSIRILLGAGKKHEEARSRHQLGRLLCAGGRESEGRAELQKAKELLSQLGLAAPAARVARDLDAATAQATPLTDAAR